MAKMHYNELRETLLRFLQNSKGKYLIPYQIFAKMQKSPHPEDRILANRLLQSYPAAQPENPPMGEGAGIEYSPATFIAHALEYIKDTSATKICKKYLNITDLNIANIAPGSYESVSIWAIPNSEEN